MRPEHGPVRALHGRVRALHGRVCAPCVCNRHPMCVRARARIPLRLASSSSSMVAVRRAEQAKRTSFGRAPLDRVHMANL